MGTTYLQSIDPQALLDTGLWFVFLVWALAFHLCRDEPDRRHDSQDRPDGC
jgi:hypothetical protein